MLGPPSPAALISGAIFSMSTARRRVGVKRRPFVLPLDSAAAPRYQMRSNVSTTRAAKMNARYMLD